METYPFEIKLPAILLLKKTEHFNIYYYPDSYAQKEIEQIALQREKAYIDISKCLNTNMEINIDLYLFNDALTKEAETQHRGAGWAFDTVMVEIYNEATKCHPYHELVHVFANKIYGTTVSFFSEGLAVFISESFCNYDFGDYVNYNVQKKVRNFYKDNELFTLKEMFSLKIGESISRPQISYPQAGSIIKYLYYNLGKETFYKLYRLLEDDYTNYGIMTNVKGFEKCCGATVEQVNKEWLSHILLA